MSYQAVAKADKVSQRDGDSHPSSSTGHLVARQETLAREGGFKLSKQHDSCLGRESTPAQAHRQQDARRGTGNGGHREVNALDVPQQFQSETIGQRGGLTLDAVQERLSSCLGIVSVSLSDRDRLGAGGANPGKHSCYETDAAETRWMQDRRTQGAEDCTWSQGRW